MKEISFQQVFKEKFERQQKIKELQYHASGNCVHIGKISPGCRVCYTWEDGGGVLIGSKCNFKCTMCYYDKQRKEQSQEEIREYIAAFYEKSLNPDWRPVVFAYQSEGETLYYLDEFKKVAEILNGVDKKQNIKIYHHLYTNGTLATKDVLKELQEMGVQELRFHLTASNCNEKVVKNMCNAAKMGFTVSVEEPSYQLHRNMLFKMLPIMEGAGVKHLNLIEPVITEKNYKDIAKKNPNGRYYKMFIYHQYDEGLVYDIMEEVIAKGYSYSVLDCNSQIENFRRGHKYLCDFSSIEGMCDDYDYFTYRPNLKTFYKRNVKLLEKRKEKKRRSKV